MQKRIFQGTYLAKNRTLKNTFLHFEAPGLVNLVILVILADTQNITKHEEASFYSPGIALLHDRRKCANPNSKQWLAVPDEYD